jgi:hypothetical protein
MSDIKTKIENSLTLLKDKKSRIYFVAQDTKGNARASIKYIYDVALALKENGFNPIILHEKKDYTGVASWLDERLYDKSSPPFNRGESLEISPRGFYCPSRNLWVHYGAN